MRTEVRFLIAVTLMMGVLVGTNFLFPPVPVEEMLGTDPVEGVAEPDQPSAILGEAPASGEVQGAGPGNVAVVSAAAPPIRESLVVVESPLYKMEFSNFGGVARSIQLLEYESFTREGPVELLTEEGSGFLGAHLVVGPDTVDLTTLPFTVSPAEGIRFSEAQSPKTLTFRYDSPTGPFFAELRYTFQPDDYLVKVEARFPNDLTRPALFLDMGSGLAFNEVDRPGEERVMGFSTNPVQGGINIRAFDRVKETEFVEGPLLWAAVKSKFFVAAILGGLSNEDDVYLGGLTATKQEGAQQFDVKVGLAVQGDGTVAYRAYFAPMERDRLTALGNDLQEVNPFGFRFIRPIIRPFVDMILWVLNFLHDNLNLSYGWVLVVFGVMMRVLTWPLNHKAMRAQIKNMAVQPLMQEIQTKYKGQPEILQKEMMKLYKEHGFNPLAGCLPMLIPMPVLFTLFFVFQNTVQLRGAPFLWLSDLSAPDPLYALPISMAISMFLIQWISQKSMEKTNPQMKMMMYAMPLVFGFMFKGFPAGLNLYYLTSNVATLPQQWMIARERIKARGNTLPKLSDAVEGRSEVQASAKVVDADKVVEAKDGDEQGSQGSRGSRRRRERRNKK